MITFFTIFDVSRPGGKARKGKTVQGGEVPLIQKERGLHAQSMLNDLHLLNILRGRGKGVNAILSDVIVTGSGT